MILVNGKRQSNFSADDGRSAFREESHRHHLYSQPTTNVPVKYRSGRIRKYADGDIFDLYLDQIRGPVRNRFYRASKVNKAKIKEAFGSVCFSTSEEAMDKMVNIIVGATRRK